MKGKKLDKRLLSERFEITGKDFYNAGKASTKIKSILKDIGINPAVIRRAGIICYEAEMNMVMYANKGSIELQITPEKINISAIDDGPGIENIELAMKEGYSTATDEMRKMGFGAGLGLPNIKRNSDKFTIDSKVNFGTTLRIEIKLN